jgi:Flp pilus assembly protein TadG
MHILSAKTPLTQRKDKRNGSALLLATLFLLALIPMVGLAIDGTHVYMMRNQIVNALNAAVLAGNRSVSLGQNFAQQRASAAMVATNTFNANIAGMPANMAMIAPSFNVSQNASKTISVSGSVTATLPLMLIGMVIPAARWPTFTVSATAQRRNVNIMLVLDHSAGMAPNAFNSNPIGALQADANQFVNMFVNNSDNIGLVGFVGAPYLADPLPNLDFQSNVPNDINSLQAIAQPTFAYNGASNPAAALSVAYAQIQSYNQPGSLNVIVLFTDGDPTAFTGNFAGLVTAGTTTCSTTANPLNGLLFTNSYAVFNARYGLSDYTAVSVNDAPEARAAAGCNISAPPGNPISFLSSMPSVDYYGNSTNGTGTVPQYPPVTLTSFLGSSINAAASNALNDAANRIRSAALPATIFVIGLGGNPTKQPDPVLMYLVANDPTSGSYNSSQPAGAYILAPTQAELQTAFTSIASQVLRLAAQ